MNDKAIIGYKKIQKISIFFATLVNKRSLFGKFRVK